MFCETKKTTVRKWIARDIQRDSSSEVELDFQGVYFMVHGIPPDMGVVENRKDIWSINMIWNPLIKTGWHEIPKYLLFWLPLQISLKCLRDKGLSRGSGNFCKPNTVHTRKHTYCILSNHPGFHWITINEMPCIIYDIVNL